MARFSLGSRRRGDVLFTLLLVGHFLVAFQLFKIQVLRRKEYKAWADRYHVRTIRIPAHRGVIRDRHGEYLAINVDAGSVSLDPSFYWDPDKWPVEGRGKNQRRVPPDKDAAARAIAAALGMDYKDVRPKLDLGKPAKFVYLKRHVSLANVRRMDALEIPGLQIDDEPRRTYPMGNLAAHVLGTTGIDGQGQSGIELKFGKYLDRKDGAEVQEVDRKGRIIPGTMRSVREPEDGASLTLTIDSRIQQVAERELNAACEKYKAAGGTCTVIDPNTGEVLAMASYPSFNPNNPGASTPDAWRCRPVTDLYEPGSTMKGLTASGALNEHKVNLTERFNCPGFLHIGARTVHDIYEGPGSFGMLNLASILSHSSNVGMSQIGMRLGPEKLDHYVRAFGLMDKSGIDLPGEPSAYLPPPEDWDRHFTATVAFGQSVNFTALRLTAAYAAIANGGTLMRPLLIKRIEWPAGSRYAGKSQDFHPEPVRRVITPETAKTITKLLQGVVTDGTGKPAKIRGYMLVGKTGSAQKALPGRGYVAGKFIASFVGFLPARNPRATILVTVDEPKGTHWGATAAAPVFREVARQTMWYLNVPPDDPNDRVDGSEPGTWHHASAGHSRRRTAHR